MPTTQRLLIRSPYLLPALGIFLIVGIALLLTSVFRGFEKQLDNARHTRDVIETVLELELLAVDAETGERGYLITGDDELLAPYQAAIEHIRETREKISTLEGLNSEQVATLNLYIDTRLQILDETIERRQDGETNAGVLSIGSLSSQEAMDQVRSLSTEILNSKKAALENSRVAYRKSLKTSSLAAFAVAALAVLSSIVALALYQRSLKSQAQRERLIRAKDRAERADREKSAFLANMSHEIRTPMNAILGFSELLQRSIEDEPQRSYLRSIRDSGHNLLALINDILDLSKVEAGRVEIVRVPLRLPELAASIQDVFEQRADDADLALKVTCSDDSPTLMLDPTRVRQILVNLVGNAIKFTHSGSVTVMLEATPAKGGSADFSATVEDTGPGISEKELPKIFTPFGQGSTTDVIKHGGTGLGLSISRRLAQLMGGQLIGENRKDGGARFTLKIPGVPTAPEGTKSPDPFTAQEDSTDFDLISPKKVLIVDDNAINLQLLEGYFHQTHHKVTKATDGFAAIEFATNTLPDIILMDIRMPGMDGTEAREKIRAEPATAHIPVIAVTASSMRDEEEQLRSDFDGFARKPVSRESLFNEMSRVLHEKTSSISTSNTSAKKTSFRIQDDALAAKIETQAEALSGSMAMVEIQEFAREITADAKATNDSATGAAASALLNAANAFQLSKAAEVLATLKKAAQR